MVSPSMFPSSRALAHFERLRDELTDSEQTGQSLLRVFLRQRPVRGLYLWGGVGRGKSFLMDTFFDSVPIERKSRVHFHRFMQDIHHRLRDLQGEENPLLQIARDSRRQLRLLCLDEFHVTDIGDAMLMRNLLQGLFDQGLVLVTTSNQEPDDLYRQWIAACPVPSCDRTDQAASRDRADRRRGGLSPARAGERRGFPFSRRRQGRSCHGKHLRGHCRRTGRARCRAGNRRPYSESVADRPGRGMASIRGIVRRSARPGRLHRTRPPLPYRT